MEVTNNEAPKVKIELTNKQLKKKARKVKKAQTAKLAHGAILSDTPGVLGASTKATSRPRQSSMSALNETIVPTNSGCSTTSEAKIRLATENEGPSKYIASDSSSDLRGQLLTQRMKFRQRIEEADKEFEALMEELKKQGIAVEAKYAGLISGIRQWTDGWEASSDANAPVSCLF